MRESMASKRREAVAEALRRGYLVAGRDDGLVVGDYLDACRSGRRPAVVVRVDRKGVAASVDYDGGGMYPDTLTELKIKAILDLCLDSGDGGRYRGDFGPDTDPDALGADLAAIVAEGSGWETDFVEWQRREVRPTDWPALARWLAARFPAEEAAT